MHPEFLRLLQYPDTVGMRVAKNHYKWQRLTKDEEVYKAGDILELAKLVDDEFAKFKRVGD